MKPRLHVATSAQTSFTGARIPRRANASIRRDINLISRQARNVAARILVVNANQDALERIGGCIAAEGHEVIAVETFELAKNFISAISPDLVVADVRLGAFNGLHLAAWIRFEPAPLRSPIIITHNGPEPVLEAEARRLGADFIVDPLHNPAFLAHVRAALAEHGRPRTGRAHQAADRSKVS